MILDKITLFLFLLTSTSLLGQNSDEIWGIGTKWTYDYRYNIEDFGYLTNEIIDTTYIDGLKLYEVETLPNRAYSGIQYFHYKEGKVYSYDPSYKILQLLYDFSNTDYFPTNYRPICDPDFPYDSLAYQEYTITIDSTAQFEMPDGSFRNLQFASVFDTTIIPLIDTFSRRIGKRTILDKIGFMQGGTHHSHDWELGAFICDELGNFIRNLRCFENDTISYNFRNYPCDSMLVRTYTEKIDESPKINFYPNPSEGEVRINGIGTPFQYHIFDLNGKEIQSGTCSNGTIQLTQKGVNLFRLRTEDGTWVYKRVVNINAF